MALFEYYARNISIILLRIQEHIQIIGAAFIGAKPAILW